MDHVVHGKLPRLTCASVKHLWWTRTSKFVNIDISFGNSSSVIARVRGATPELNGRVTWAQSSDQLARNPSGVQPFQPSINLFSVAVCVSAGAGMMAVVLNAIPSWVAKLGGKYVVNIIKGPRRNSTVSGYWIWKSGSKWIELDPSGGTSHPMNNRPKAHFKQNPWVPHIQKALRELCRLPYLLW